MISVPHLPTLSLPLGGSVAIIRQEIASSLSLLAMTKIQMKLVIASDRRERGNLIKIIAIQSLEGRGGNSVWLRLCRVGFSVVRF
jgi:hypothetical protein